MHENLQHNLGPWGARTKLVLIGFSLVGGFFLIAEHRAHVLPFLPWLLLAACPLMHMFGHGAHGHGGHGGDSAENDRTARTGGPGENSHAGHTTIGNGASGTRGTGLGEPKAATPPPDRSHYHGGSQS